MWSKLEEVFEEMKLPYDRQGNYGGHDDSFFTYWNIRTPETRFYDNKPRRSEWVWSIIFYTRYPELMYTKLDELIRILREKGFVVNGRGNDIPSDEVDYIGRVITATYVEHYGGAI